MRYLYIHVRYKSVQNLKIHNKRKNARKKFLFAPIWSEGHWTFFHVKEKVSKSDLRSHSHVILRRFMQIRLSLKYLAGKGSVIRSRQHAFFTRSGVDGLTVQQEWRIHNCYITKVSRRERTEDVRKKPYFIEWNTQFSTMIWRNGEFGGSSTKW